MTLARLLSSQDSLRLQRSAQPRFRARSARKSFQLEAASISEFDRIFIELSNLYQTQT